MNSEVNKSQIHFCHANGFPAKSYSVMLDALEQDFSVAYLDMFGHQEAYPVTEHWPYLVDELIEQIERLHTEPVVAVGHSLGGGLIYLAARKRPELFKHLILLDPALMDHLTSRVVRLAKRFNFIDKITPAGRTYGRQETFKDHEHALQYFKGKTLFENADPRCLKDYVYHGTESTPDGIRLRYSAETEVAIYRTLPHNIRHSKKHLDVGASFLYGASSKVVRPGLIKQMKKIGMNTYEVPGGHLFPLEFPEQSAKKIKQIIEAL